MINFDQVVSEKVYHRETTPKQSQLQTLLLLMLIGGGLFFIYRIRAILPLFVAGFLLAYLLDPIVDQLESRGWSRNVAALIAFSFFLLLFAIIVLTIAPLIISQAQALIEECMPPNGRYYIIAVNFIKRLEENNASQNPLLAYASQVLNSFSKQVGDFILERIKWAVTSIGSIISLLLLPIVTYYSLQVIDPLRQRIFSLLPPQHRAELTALLRETGKLIGRYFRGYMLLCACVGIVNSFLLWLLSLYFGNKYAIAIGFFSGITYSIPYFGTITSTLLAFAIGYLTSNHHNMLTAILSSGVIIVVNQVFDWLVMPKVVGQKVGLPPIVAIFAVMAGSVAFGVLGMIIAVPLAGCIKLALMQFMPKLFEQPEDESGKER